MSEETEMSEAAFEKWLHEREKSYTFDKAEMLEAWQASSAHFQQRLERAEAALRVVLASAHPNEQEHPTMFKAWKEAQAALAPAQTEQEGK